MSLVNLRFWNKSKVALINPSSGKEIPLEIRGSIIDEASMTTEENSATRDLFWVKSDIYI